MAGIWKFEDLEIWKVARVLCSKVYTFSEEGRLKRDFSMKDQIKRSASSVMANIAEGYMRGGNREFIQFLFIARGSAGETKSFLYLAMDIGYIERQQFEDCDKILNELVNKMDAFIKYLRRNINEGIKTVR